MNWKVGDIAKITSAPDVCLHLNFYRHHLHKTFKVTGVPEGEDHIIGSWCGMMSKKFLTNVTKEYTLNLYKKIILCK